MSKGGGKVEETEQQRSMAEHAMNLMQDYRQRWEPMQMKLAGQIARTGEEGSAAQKLAEGRTTADVSQAFSNAEGALEKQLTNSGAAPGSSKANLAMAEFGTNKAKSRGLGQTIADQQIQDAYTQGLGALTSIGRGERASVGSALGQQAALSGQQAQADAQVSLMNAMGNYQLGGQVAGFGMQQAMKGFGTPKITGDYSSMATPDVQGANGGFGWKGGVGGL